MADLTNTPLAINYRKAKGFSNFSSRNVVFYTVYISPKTQTNQSFLDEYNNNVQNNEFSQIVSTIAFAGVELFFLGEPAETMGPIAFTIGVNSDTSNMGELTDWPGYPAVLANNLSDALGNAGWMNIVVKMIVDHDSIHSPFIGS